jgi:hypothetical protein
MIKTGLLDVDSAIATSKVGGGNSITVESSIKHSREEMESSLNGA